MEILNQFGINGFLLTAQVVNFFILLLILKRFLYKPVLRVLDERKKKVEESLKNAEEIERRLNEIAEKEAEVILKAGKEGQKIIQEAGNEYKQIIADAKKEYDRIVNKAEEDSKKLIAQQQILLMNQVKGNLSGIVVLSLEKVLGKKATKEQMKIVDRVTEES